MNKVCGKCGQKNNGNSIYCFDCGDKLLEQNICARCSQSLNARQSYCHICGAKVGKNEISKVGDAAPAREKTVSSVPKVIVISALTSLFICVLFVIVVWVINLFGLSVIDDNFSAMKQGANSQISSYSTYSEAQTQSQAN